MLILEKIIELTKLVITLKDLALLENFQLVYGLITLFV